MTGIPAFWRVTLTWPRPGKWGKPNARGHVPYEQSSPETIARTLGWQLQERPGAVEVAEMRSRTVRMVMRLPAQEPRAKRVDYACSAALAVDWALMVAQFGANLVGCRGDIYAPLPEPVRIAVEPVAHAEA